MNFFEKFKKSSDVQMGILALVFNLLLNISIQLIKTDPSPYRWTWNIGVILFIFCLLFQVSIADTDKDLNDKVEIILIFIIGAVGFVMLLYSLLIGGLEHPVFTGSALFCIVFV